MKKLSLLIGMASLGFATFLVSCDTEEDPTPVTVTESECDTSVYPANTGDATVNLLNYSSSTITVEAGNLLSLAVEITAGTKRAQKIRLFQSDCINLVGNEVDLSDQPKGGKNGIDLRATDNAQVRNVTYSIPTGFTVIYLTIEVDEAGGNSTYKQLTLNVSGSGVIDTWSSVELGGNSNALASRMSSGTGQTYSACNAAENMDYIDITYAVKTTTPFNSYIASNPARFLAPVSLGNSTAANCEDGVTSTSTAGGNAAYFASTTLTAAEFTSATNATLEALTVSTASNQYIEVTAAGQVFAFMNFDGKKGLIKVESVNALNTTGGSITVSVKVQR